MIRNAVFFAAIAGSLSLVSCKNNNSDEEKGMPMQNQHRQDPETNMESGNSAATPKFKEEVTGRIYEAYNGIKEALVEGDAMQAQEAAQNLLNEIKKDNERTQLVNAANKIVSSEELSVQREAFSKLGDAMQPVLSGALASGEIYKQFCPMAFEGQGAYWYSNSKQIRNPYFGDKMLNCGRTEETLN